MSIDRRQALKLLGGALVLGACAKDGNDDGGGAAATSASSSSTTSTTAFDGAASCTVAPEQTAGPFYLDVDAIRSDIREDREGTPLKVSVRVLDADGCTPLKDAVFEIWHCDADGDYSGFGDAPKASRFLRGAQVTDAAGVATILTIYPGWYEGRAVHIHAMVHLNNAEVLTTQLYFDDAVSNEVFAAAPYSRRGKADVSNSRDRIFRPETMLTTVKEGDGYVGRITIGVRA